MHDYYKILNIPRDAPAAAVKAARKARLRLFHPDINKSPDAERKAQLINSAADTLLQPAARARYDKTLAAHDALQECNASRQPSRGFSKQSKAPPNAAQEEMLRRAAERAQTPNGAPPQNGIFAFGNLVAGIVLFIIGFKLLAALFFTLIHFVTVHLPAVLALIIGFYLLKRIFG